VHFGKPQKRANAEHRRRDHPQTLLGLATEIYTKKWSIGAPGGGPDLGFSGGREKNPPKSANPRRPARAEILRCKNPEKKVVKLFGKKCPKKTL